jgi:hypothetical protein
MPHPEIPPVNRMRESPMHGLKGILLERSTNIEEENRIYQ